MATLHPVLGQLQARRPLRPAFTLNPVDGGSSVDGGGGFDTGGGGFDTYFPLFGSTGGNGGPGYGVPIIVGGGGGTTPTTSTGTGTATSASWLDSALKYFTGTGCGVGDFLLRIAFFILGIGSIFAAIYLYKGSNTILQIPAHITRGVVRAGKTAIETGAEA